MDIDDALKYARPVLEKLSKHCLFISMAGSVRRKRIWVKDIEIVCVPRLIEIPNGLFDKQVVRDPVFVDIVRSLGTIERGKPDVGKYVKIILNSLVGLEPIALDLFITNPSDYGRQLAIRTGSSKYSMSVIARGWVKKGWVGTPDGLRRRDQCANIGTTEKPRWKGNHPDIELPPLFPTEESFFEFIGVPIVPPSRREL